MQLQKLKQLSKKGLSLDLIPRLVITLILVGAFLAVGYKLFASMKTGETNSDVLNAINNITLAMTTGIVNNLGLIVLVFGFVIVLGAVSMLGGGFGRSKRGISLEAIPTIVLTLVIVGVFLAIGYKLFANMLVGETNLDVKSAIGNITSAMTTGIVNNMGLIVLVFGFVIVLGAVSMLGGGSLLGGGSGRKSGKRHRR